MKTRHVLTSITPRRRKTNLSLAAAVASVLMAHSSHGAVVTWDGGGVAGTDLGTAVNWSGDVLPSVATPDTALWNGTVAGPLTLVYSNTAFAGAAGNLGLNFNLSGAQTASVNIDSGGNTGVLRMDDITLDAGAGAFSLGDGANTFNITLGGVAAQVHAWANNSSNTMTVGSDVVFGLGGGGTHTIALAGSGSWAFNNSLTGAIVLTKTGAGTVTLSGAANAITGALGLSQGVVNLATNLGLGGATIINGTGGTINSTGGSILLNVAAGDLGVSNGGFLTINAVIANGTQSSLDFWNTGSGSGVVILTADNTFSGTTSLQSGIISVGKIGNSGVAGNLGTNGTINLGTTGSSATLRYTGVGETNNRVINLASTTNTVTVEQAGTGLLKFTSALTATVNGAKTLVLTSSTPAAGELAGAIVNSTGTTAVLKSGNNTWTLSGVNAYTGLTTVNGGTLLLDMTTGSLAATTALTLGGGNFTVKGLAGGTSAQTMGAVALAVTTASTIAIDPNNDTSTTLTLGDAWTRNANSSLLIDYSSANTGTRQVVTANATTGATLTNGIYGWMLVKDSAGVTGFGTRAAGASQPIARFDDTTGTTLADNSNTAATNFTTLNTTYTAGVLSWSNGITTRSVNSLTIDTTNSGGIIDMGAAGNILTLTSAGVLFKGPNDATIQGGQLGATASEVIVHQAGTGTLTIASPIGSGAGSFLKDGSGAVTISGTNTYTGVTALAEGTVNLTGSISSAGLIAVGTKGTGNTVLNISGGTLSTTANANPSFVVGNGTGTSTFVNMTSGSISNTGTASQFYVGRGQFGTNATITMSGGTITSGSWIVLGFNNDRSLINQSGGTINVSTNRMTIAAGGNNAMGVYNISGTGIFNATSGSGGMYVGENGVGILNVSGSAAVNLATNGLTMAQNLGGNGTVNLLGGTITTNRVSQNNIVGASSGVFNFNGGTLKSNAVNATFMTGLTAAYVHPGGAIVDDGGNAITIGQSLLAPAGNGVGTPASFTGGTGYVATPIVQITGGGGTGATAVAAIAGGVVTGITITNPGVGYTSVPTFTMIGGGFTTAATATGAAPTANSSGGFTKMGAGTLTLSGASTYTGATSVNNGTLSITGSLSTSSAVTVNSATTLTGTPTASLGNVTIASGGTLTPGTAGVATITVTGLTLASGSTLNYEFGVGNDAVTVTTPSTGLQLNGGDFNLFATGTVNPYSTNGTYTVFNYTTAFGGSVNNFGITPATTVAGKTYVFSTTGSAVQLTIGDATPIDWTGDIDGTWGSNANWTGTFPNAAASLARFGTALTGASVMTVSVGAGGKTVGGIIFDNASPYTINSGGGSLTFDNGVVASAIAVTNGVHALSAPVVLTKAISITTANAGAGLNLSGDISGAFPVILSGSGAVTLSGSNTHASTTLNGGTLNIDSATAVGTGVFTIAAGTIDNTSGSPKTLTNNNAQSWNGNFTFTGTDDLNLGTGAVTLSATRTVTTTGASSTLIVGGGISGVGAGLTKAGDGTLRLDGANTYNGSTIVKAGTLAVTAGTLGALTADIQISPEVGNAGTLTIAGGIVNANRVIIGGNSANNGAPQSGAVLQSGGVINSQQWFTVGSGGGGNALTGTYTMTGGTLNVIAQQMEVGNFAAAAGVVTMSGASAITIQNSNSIALGANANSGDGTFTQNGGTVTFYSDAGTTVGGNGILYLGKSGTLSGTFTYNLNAGTLTVPQISRVAGNGVFNFNGGTLTAAKNNATYMQGLSQANVLVGGAIIDTGAFAVTILQDLFSGVVGDGGLTKLGAGTMTYTGNAFYDGATTISAGTLRLDGSGSVNGSSGISINGAGARFVQTSAVAVSPAVTINNGTLDGTTSVATVSVASGAGNIIANGNGGSAALAITTLTFDDAATLNLTTSSTAAVLNTVTLTTGAINAAGLITVNPANASWANATTYDLISYTGAIGGIGFGEFTLGTVTGLTPRQTATLTNPAGFVSLSIVGDIPVWTGLNSGDWTIAVIPPNKNWKLQTGGGQTDFLTNDSVLFDDTATGTTTVTISGANVNPTSTTFNNSTNIYTIGGGFGIASGFLTKNGSALVTISTNNSYTGNTTVTDGTLNMTGDNTFGVGGVTVSGGTATFSGTNSYSGGTNVSGGALVMSGNNTLGVGSVTVSGGTATFSGSNSYTGGTIASGGVLVMSGNNTFGAGTVTVSGGTATLSGVNTYTGLTTLSSGTLNVDNAAALGSAALVITGGTLGNTSGNDIILVAAKAQNWNGDFTYDSPDDLDFNLGAVTIGGPAGQRTVTVNTGTLTTGLWTAAAGFGLTKAGAGTLAMSNTANTSVINGLLDIQAGKIQIHGDLTVNNGLSGAGTIENGGAASKWFYVNNPGDTTFSGTIQDNPNNAAVRLGLVKRGAGALTLSGSNNTYTDRLAIEAGKLILTGTNTTSFGAGGNQTVLVGTAANTNGVLEINGGTLNANRTAAPGLTVAGVANGSGFIKMTSGALNVVSQLNIGNGNGAVGTEAYAALSMSGGTLTSGSWLVVGANNDRAVLNQSGGDIVVSTNRMTIGAGGAGSIGVVNMSGGTFSDTAGIYVGENGRGTLNVSGTAALTMGTLQFGANNAVFTALSGTANLLGGTVSTGSVTRGNASVTPVFLVNFNGGKLKATADNAAFFANLADTAAYVYSGGGTIDDGGFAVTVAEDLLAPGGNGVSAASLTVSGGGYLDTPLVLVAGGDGVGAAAVATIDGSGNLTGITITNPGTGYTVAPTFTLAGGGVGNTGSIGGAVDLVANTSGTLTKAGVGTLTLTGTQTYSILRTTAGTTNVDTSFTGGTSTVNANATTNFSVSQTLNALNIGTVPLAGFGESPGFTGGASAVVPEPGSIALLLVGALGTLGRRRRRA